jgi:hypothetical protein
MVGDDRLVMAVRRGRGAVGGEASSGRVTAPR